MDLDEFCSGIGAKNRVAKIGRWWRRVGLLLCNFVLLAFFFWHDPKAIQQFITFTPYAPKPQKL